MIPNRKFDFSLLKIYLSPTASPRLFGLRSAFFLAMALYLMMKIQVQKYCKSRLTQNKLIIFNAFPQ